jgi:hypothetical protein
MIVDDLEVICVAISPNEANPPLIVDPDAVLALPIRSKVLQPIARWCPEITEASGVLDLHELSVCHLDDVVRDPLDKAPLPGGLSRSVPERFNHSLC